MKNEPMKAMVLETVGQQCLTNTAAETTMFMVGWAGGRAVALGRHAGQLLHGKESLS